MAKPQINHMRISRHKVMTITSGRRKAEITACMLTRERGDSGKTTLLVEAVDRNGEVRSMSLTGKQARTLFNVMQKHYLRDDKPAHVAQRAYEDGFEHGIKVATEISAAAIGICPSILRAAIMAMLIGA